MVEAKLPFLIVYGAWVWKAILVGFAAFFVACVVVVRRWRERGRVSGAIALQRHLVTPIAPGNVALFGVLRGGSLTSIAQSYRDSDFRDGEPWLDVDGTRIEMIGSIHVDAGSRVETRWWSFGRIALLHTQAYLGSTVIRTLTDGDEVAVTGLLRDAKNRRELVGDAGPIIARSVAPRVAPLPLGPFRIAVLGGLAALIGYGVLHHIGASKLDENTLASDRRDDLEIAAAMPGSRETALEQLDSDVIHAHEDDNNDLSARAALAELVGECPEDLFARAGALDDAIAASMRCGTRYDVALTLATEGRFDDAMAWIAPGNDALAATVAIAQARWLDAAELIEHHAEQFRGSYEEPRGLDELCAAALIRSFAGEHDTFARLVNRKTSRACAIDEALTLDGDQRTTALLNATERDDEDFDDPFGTRALVVLAGADRVRLDRFNVFDSTRSRPEVVTWLARSAPYDHFMPWRAYVDRARGDFAAARADVAAAVRDGFSNSEARALDEDTSLAEGTPIAALVDPDRPDEWERLASGEPIAPDSVELGDLHCSLAQGLQLARAGDGRALASALVDCNIGSPDLLRDVLAVLPHVVSHRDELAAALRAKRKVRITFNPFEVAAQAARYRDLSRLAGDDREATTWQTIFERTDAVLADPRKVIAYLVWRI